MKQKYQKDFCLAATFLVAFMLWTVLIRVMDVQPFGPSESAVGFGYLNRYIHDVTGVHMELYVLTDWLSVIPIGIVLLFGAVGLCQWIRRRSLKRVDADILLLGAFYLLVIAAYGFFEVFVINFRPVLIEGRLEASYPSSTTVLVLCVMLTAAMQAKARIRSRTVKKWIVVVMLIYSAFMVIGRLTSGVHWFTDIAGGVLLSAGLVMLYRGYCRKIG